MAILDVAREEEIPPGNALRVVVGETPIAIFNVHGELFAIGDTCSHEDYSLAEGEIEESGDGCTVECALHGARFDLRTGAALSLPAVLPVGSFPVWIEDGVVKLEVPEALAHSVA
jgi:3-phenylpropionate/trans-cinnamate dioxygenase ferredoxin subunit